MKGIRSISTDSGMFSSGRGSEEDGEAVGDFLLGSEEITMPRKRGGAQTQSAGGIGLGPLDQKGGGMPKSPAGRVGGSVSAGFMGSGLEPGRAKSPGGMIPAMTTARTSSALGTSRSAISRDSLRSSQSGRKGVSFVGVKPSQDAGFDPSTPTRYRPSSKAHPWQSQSDFDSASSEDQGNQPNASPPIVRMPALKGTSRQDSGGVGGGDLVPPGTGSSWKETYQDYTKPYSSLPSDGGARIQPQSVTPLLPQPLRAVTPSSRLEALEVRTSSSFGGGGSFGKAPLPMPSAMATSHEGRSADEDKKHSEKQQPSSEGGTAATAEGDLYTQLNLLRERSMAEQQSLRRQLDDGRAEREELRREVQAANARGQELDEENRRLREGAMQAGDDQGMLRTIEEKNVQISQLENLLRQLAGSKGGPAAVAQSQATELARVKKELEESKAQRAREAKDLKELEETVDKFEAKMELLKKENKELRQAGAELKQLLAESEKASPSGSSIPRTSSIARTGSIGGLEPRGVRGEAEFEKIEAQLRQVSNALEVEKQQAGRMAQRLMEAESASAALRNDAGQLQAKVRQLEDSIDAERSRANAQEKPLGDGEVAELRVRRDELVRSLREATDKVDAMERSMENERKHKIGLALSRQARVTSTQVIMRWRSSIVRGKDDDALSSYISKAREMRSAFNALVQWRYVPDPEEQEQRQSEVGAGQEELAKAKEGLAKAVKERDEARMALIALQQQDNSDASACADAQQQQDSQATRELDRLLGSLREGSEAGLFASGMRPDASSSKDVASLAKFAADKVAEALRSIDDRRSQMQQQAVSWAGGGHEGAENERMWQLQQEAIQAREADKEARHQLVVAESKMEQERARLEAQLFTAKSKIARLEKDKGPQQDDELADEMEQKLLAASKKAAEARAGAAMWEAECTSLRKAGATKDMTIEKLGKMLKIAGEQKQESNAAAASEESRSKSTSANEASIRALEETLGEVTAMWKSASKELRASKAREEEARASARDAASRSAGLLGDAVRGKEEAEAKAGSLSVEIAVHKGEADKALKEAEEQGRRRREAEKKVEEGAQEVTRLKAEIASGKAERERERGEASEKEHRLNLQLRKSAAEADIMREQAKARLNEVLAEMAGLPKMIEEVRDNGASEKRRSDALMRRLETLEKELDEATRSGEELRLSLSDSESQGKADKRQISGLEAEISTLKAELQQQESARGAAADALSDHRLKLAELERKLSQSEATARRAAEVSAREIAEASEQGKLSLKMAMMQVGSFEDVAGEIVEELEGNLERVAQMYIKTIRSTEVKGELMYNREKRRADNLQAECDRVEELRTAADQARIAAVREVDHTSQEVMRLKEAAASSQVLLDELRDRTKSEAEARQRAEGSLREARDELATMRLELVKSTDALRGAESKNEGRDKSDAENREKLRASEERCADINRRLGDVAAEKEQLQMMVVDLEGKLRNLEIEVKNAEFQVKNAEFQVKNAEFQKTAEREKQEAEEEADRYKRLAMKKEEEISALRVETRSEIDRVTALNTDLTRQLEIERNEVKAKREEIIATKEEVVSMKEQAMRSKETSMVALDRLQVEVSKSRIRASEMEAALSEKESTRERALRKLEEEQNSNIALRRRADEALTSKEELEAAKSKVEAERSDLEARLESVSTLLKAEKEKFLEQTSQIMVLEQRTFECEADALAVESAVKKLEDFVEEVIILREQKQAMIITIRTLEQTISAKIELEDHAARAKLDAIKKAEESGSIASALGTEIQQLRTKSSNLEQALKAAVERAAEAEASFETIVENSKRESEIRMSLSADVQASKEETAAKQREVERLNERLQAAITLLDEEKERHASALAVVNSERESVMFALAEEEATRQAIEFASEEEVSGLKKRLEGALSSAEELKEQIVEQRNKAEEATALKDRAERQVRQSQADMADMQSKAEGKMAELARTIGEMENSLRLAEDRAQALEKEVNEATKERDLREERAGVMATAWRMRAENGEADARNAKKALAEAEAATIAKARELARVQGALAESQAVLSGETERVVILEAGKQKLMQEIERLSRDKVDEVMSGSSSEVAHLKATIKSLQDQLFETQSVSGSDKARSEASTSLRVGTAYSNPSTNAISPNKLGPRVRTHHMAELSNKRHLLTLVKSAFGVLAGEAAHREADKLRGEIKRLENILLSGGGSSLGDADAKKRMGELEERARVAEQKFEQLYSWVQSKANEARQQATRGGA